MFVRTLCALSVLHIILGVRINFSSCQNPRWTCVNNSPNEIVYSCSAYEIEAIIHIKDYHADQSSVTIQNCKDVKVVLDCSYLVMSARLQHFKIKDCDKLEFVTISSNSLLQTPSQFTIENVKEVTSLPRGIFKSPVTNTERKCLGVPHLRSIIVKNSKINTIQENAVFNVTGIKRIEFQNVSITTIESRAIDASMSNDNALFTINSCKIDNIRSNSVKVETQTATITGNHFGDFTSRAINITANNLQISRNNFAKIEENGISLKGSAVEITNNNIDLLSSNALTNIKCTRQRKSRHYLKFSNNTIKILKPYSLWFDYSSCRSSGGSVTINNNKLHCKCEEVSFLTFTNTSHRELNDMILDPTNNNTCLSAPCVLPVEVVKTLIDSHMCQINLDPQVTCLLYYDKKSNPTESTVTDEEEMTEQAPTFYLIRQASVPNGDASAAMTAIDRDNLLRDSHLNMTNRTSIQMVFDASRDFVDTLRSTSVSHRHQNERKRPVVNEYSVTRCTGHQCRDNVAYDRQKALDFYKYVYAQLRPPKQNENKNKL